LINNEFISLIEKLFAAHADQAKGLQMAAYMKNQFSFYGIQKPLRQMLSKELITAYSKLAFTEISVLVKGLWERPEREMQYVAMDILYKVKIQQNSIKLFEYLVMHKSWWDSVDLIAVKLIGPYFSIYPKYRDIYIKKWTKSKNMWLNRTAILFQLKYQSQTDLKLLSSLIRQHKDSDEFFIQKAIGWVLREYAYTDAKWVKNFVKEIPLKPLSKREALKHFK
jgi:3-methyladenine DNA glycosylase AlkD